MKYFNASYSSSDASKDWSNDVHLNNYYAAKSIKDVIQKENIKVCSYTLNKVNKYGAPIKIEKWRTPAGKGYGQWEENPEFDFEKDLPNIIAVRDGDSYISEIKIDFL
jgi:hypothetical protein